MNLLKPLTDEQGFYDKFFICQVYDFVITICQVYVCNCFYDKFFFD